jgi:hypothetical protein
VFGVIRASREDWGIFVDLHESTLHEIDTRLAVLDAPPVFAPTDALNLAESNLKTWGRERGFRPARAFEEASLAHARSLIPAFDDLTLCEDNAISIDFHTPKNRMLVGQVKSGRTATKPPIDQALGAATLPGRGARRQHLFFYSEAGYKSGSYEFADERGIFLWHIDFHGRVLPWSASARWLVSRTDELRVVGIEQAQEILDQCAWKESADRISARMWAVDEVQDLWLSVFGPIPERTRPWRHFVSWAIQASEHIQGARQAVKQMFRQYLFESRAIVQQFSPDWPPPELVDPHHLWWRDPAFRTQRHHQAYRLCWIGNGGGPVTEASINWPDLPDEQMAALFTWNDNCWDGDTEYQISRNEELRQLNGHRREAVGGLLKILIADFKARGLGQHAAALQALRAGHWDCNECIGGSGYLSDVEDFGPAPHLIEAERVWAAMLRGERVPPQMYEGFSQGADAAHLWWRDLMQYGN